MCCNLVSSKRLLFLFYNSIIMFDVCCYAITSVKSQPSNLFGRPSLIDEILQTCGEIKRGANKKLVVKKKKH